MCNWVHLPDKQNPDQRLCGRPGHPYCLEHTREIDVMEQAYKGWDEILAALSALCEEPTERGF
jgi:hypothetical protein